MKAKLYVGSLIVLVLSACSESQDGFSPVPENSAIVGGIDTNKNDTVSNYVVLIYDNPTKTYCTGTLIKRNLILTAAHCVGEKASDLSLAFGINPLTGNYVLRKAYKTATHDKYKKLSSKDRNDLGLISMKETAPLNYRPVELADASFPLKKGQVFTAAGYGRISGKRSTPTDTQGSGQLRNVDLTINQFSQDETQFYIDQKNGKGICSGDSGGPALMRYQGKDYVVGVASAVSWTVPDEVKADERNQYIQNKDVCKEKSIYMNVKSFRVWIDTESKKLLN
ncbi:trypsin-like serine protease [Bdellovibrio bacteriovorus]|uniref:S1 family peptidase n=1 Tax=Bdellovibrio bacteriovorus TaxID=959 RepID=UPI0021CEDD2D|nr:trypsin-like serine protease [Bdellovibrio bacteriovorus]UXR64196.1 trypsin-like serine protease [Bdellovibrio bacteriovorus]